MGVSALDYHAKGGKHQRNLKDSEEMDIPSMLNKKSQSQLLPTKRLRSINKPQPNRMLLVLLNKDPFMCLLKK